MHICNVIAETVHGKRLIGSKKPINRLGLSWMQPLNEHIQKAARFEVEPDVVKAVYDIRRGNVLSFVSGLDLIRLPYPKVWVEWTYPENERDWAPSRTGWLLMEDGDRILGYHIHLDDEGDAILSLYRMVFERHAEVEIITDFETAKAEMLEAHDKAVAGGINWTGASNDEMRRRTERLTNTEIQAHVAINSKLVANPIGRFGLDPDYWPELNSVYGSHQSLQTKFITALAMVMMMNARNNVIDVQPAADMAKINKKRVARGNAPLMTLQPIKLDISRRIKAMERAGGKADSDAKNAMKAHMVRGHFKIRRSGIFWWSPFVRAAKPGEAKPMVKPYLVTDGEKLSA